ncbi:ectoine synthase [Roseomonas sp. CCTCC AB2023176]|uniref:ectoine synthase n=1 Tax=Roseomonas sp. CCTCC AB2023176 TaxID=3342640 RepID=UPI0035DAFDDB
MPVRLITKAALQGTSRHVVHDTYETTRFLLAEDGLGVTVTDIVLQPGVEATYGYDEHVEIAYCLEGRAVIHEVGSGRRLDVAAGSLWVAERGDRFTFLASEPTRLICVFTPPFRGHETGFAGDQ